MRLYGISAVDVEWVVARPMSVVADSRGNPRLTGVTHEGRAIIVVIAGDDPNFVITAFPGD